MDLDFLVGDKMCDPYADLIEDKQRTGATNFHISNIINSMANAIPMISETLQ